MEQYIIKGGKPLAGEVSVSGSKNAALAILAGAIMSEEEVRIENLPDISDIHILLQIISDAGIQVEQLGRNSIRMNAGHLTSVSIDSDEARKIRGSYYLLGALLGKYKSAQVALPGGCNIGSRPIDQHIKGFEALGAMVKIQHGLVKVQAERLSGSHIYMDVSTVGATINIMLAAVLAEGQTILENAAKEPHVVDTANFLNSMGAEIKGAGTDVIRIRGVKRLHGTTYSIIPDQIEAGTFMLAAAATRGDVVIKNIIPKHLEAISAKLLEAGAEIYEQDDSIRVVAAKRLGHTQIKTLPYPGFPTDLQSQITTVLSMCQGTSIVTESIFENRFKYVDELTKMGALIKVEGTTAIIDGACELTGATVVATDLRAGAALVIAGLSAEGTTIVEHVEFIERGYEDFEYKLTQLGAAIRKVDSTNEKEMRKFALKVG